MLGNKALFLQVEKAKTIFDLKEDGTVELKRAGQALAIFKSRAMQRDVYTAKPADYFYGTGIPDADKRTFEEKVGILRVVLTEMGIILGNIGSDLSEAEVALFSDAYNQAQEHMTKGLQAVQARIETLTS